jgi:hypothetical protein
METEKSIKIDQYPVLERHQLNDVNKFVIFRSYPKEGVKYVDILGKEVCFYGSNDEFIWQISPDIGKTNLLNMIFDKADTSDWGFVSIEEKDGSFFALRGDGDTFEIDMETGKAKFAYWQRN